MVFLGYNCFLGSFLPFCGVRSSFDHLQSWMGAVLDFSAFVSFLNLPCLHFSLILVFSIFSVQVIFCLLFYA
jgi:hypothetical protein